MPPLRVYHMLAFSATIQLLAEEPCLGYCVSSVVGSQMIMMIQVHIAIYRVLCLLIE